VTFDQIDREIRLCYGAHQALLRIGFAAEHLFCGINGGRVLVVLRPPEKPEFVLTACEETSMTFETFATKWSALVEALQVQHSVSAETREQMFDEFRGLFSALPLITALMGKGLLPL
jgi:hypothetical protein